MTESAFIAPKLTMRVGVTGHLPKDLAGWNEERLRQKIDEVLKFVKMTAAGVQSENNFLDPKKAPYGQDGFNLRCMTLLRPGATQFASERAECLGYSIHAILPAKQNLYSELLADGDRAAFNDWFERKRLQSHLALDHGPLPNNDEALRRAGYLMIAHVDVLIAVWDGSICSRPGSTTDLVAEAQRRGVEIIWISSDEVQRYKAENPLDDPSNRAAWDAVDLTETDNTSADEMRQNLNSILAGPPDGKALKSFLAFRKLKLRNRSCAFLYNAVVSVFALRRPSGRLKLRLAENRESWAGSLKQARSIGGDAYQESLRTLLLERWVRADNIALQYAHKFRSAYVANFLLAALAVAVGLIAMFFSHSKGVPLLNAMGVCPEPGTAFESKYCSGLLAKSATVVLELLILAAIVLITFIGRQRRWQEHCMAGRSLAEILRPSRLHFIIAGAPYRRSTHTDESSLQEHQAWLPWYVRASLREIELPTDAVSQKDLQNAIDIAIDEELNAQEAYHERTRKVLKALDHRLEIVCLICLGAAFLVGGIYLVEFVQISQAKPSAAWTEYESLYSWKAPATYAGGVLPAVGAALFGIRLIGDFKSAARQSERMLGRIDKLRSRYRNEWYSPARLSLRELNARTTMIMADDILIWNMIFSERELTPGA